MVELAVGAQILSLLKGTDLDLKIGRWKPDVQLRNYHKHGKHAFLVLLPSFFFTFKSHYLSSYGNPCVTLSS